jgi:hypothetical protein
MCIDLRRPASNRREPRSSRAPLRTISEIVRPRARRSAPPVCAVTDIRVGRALAGALGRPVWIALNRDPEWRWQRLRDDSTWYPAARLFRQQTLGDWGSVFARMTAEVAQLLDAAKCTDRDRQIIEQPV